MSYLGPTSDPARRRLIDLRQVLIRLHKALLDSERNLYEKVHGPIGSAGQFLQLLIGDGWFAWLKPVTSLVAEIDETLTARERVRQDDFDRLFARAEKLFVPPDNGNGFTEHYRAAIQRDPEVAFLHAEVARLL